MPSPRWWRPGPSPTVASSTRSGRRRNPPRSSRSPWSRVGPGTRSPPEAALQPAGDLSPGLRLFVAPDALGNVAAVLLDPLHRGGDVEDVVGLGEEHRVVEPDG